MYIDLTLNLPIQVYGCPVPIFPFLIPLVSSLFPTSLPNLPYLPSSFPPSLPPPPSPPLPTHAPTSCGNVRCFSNRTAQLVTAYLHT